MTRRRPWLPIEECCIDIRLAAWGEVSGQLPLVAVDPEPAAWIAHTSPEPNLFDQLPEEDRS